MTMHRYEPRNPLQAIDPKAFFGLFSSVEKPENDQSAEATIVTIRGPLSQHDEWWQDSYESIRGRVVEACQQSAPIVILRIDSPGGDVAGCFDTARFIRSECDRTGKQLITHVEGQCCSAAYALASTSDRIAVSRSAEVGSIGIIAARLDETKAMEEHGYKVTLITSGARKADGYSCQPMEEGELAAFQEAIDELAEEFFDLVSLNRGIPTEEIAAFEAASFRGKAAKKAGLVDELSSFEQLIESLGAATGVTMALEREKEARDALSSIAEDEDEDEQSRERARKALAALDDDEEAEDEDNDEEAEDEDNDEEAEDEDEDEQAKTSRTVSASTAGALAAHGSKIERRLAKLEQRESASERKRLIAAHGGVPKGMAKLLSNKPLYEVKALLAELPKPKKPKLGDHAATTTVPGTRGDGQENASQLPPEEARGMKLAMGLDVEEFGVVERGNSLLLGALKSTEGGE